MNSRSFDEWFSTFRPSLEGYGYDADFSTVHAQIEQFKLEIAILNFLVGSQNIERDFERILIRHPRCLNVLPLLLPFQGNNFHLELQKSNNYLLGSIIQPIEQYKYFMRRTGLFDLLANRQIRDLREYLTGFCVSSALKRRKNRGGKQMERLVARFLNQAGVEYFTEKYDREVEEMFGLDLSAITANRTSSKRFDFVVKAANKVFVIETNFYTGGGSKLNETARSYKAIAEAARGIEGFAFVWITDGKGWRRARGNLQETFLALPTLYNIRDMEDGIFLELFNE